VTRQLDAVVVDTNVLSWLLQGRTDPLSESYRQLVGSHRVVVPFQVVAEIRYGMRRARWGELRVRQTERTFATLSVAQPDDEVLTTYAALRFRAVEQGQALGDKIHDGDRWIAATAVRAELPLVSHDAVFLSIEGLDLRTILRQRR